MDKELTLGERDPTDLPALLTARLRAGELSASHVRWAAACGDELARALGGTGEALSLSQLAEELAATPLEAGARFWGALVRGGYDQLGGDDRYLATIWAFERSLAQLPTGGPLAVLGYATRASDALWPADSYATTTLATVQGSPPHPEFRHSWTPTQALDALRRWVPEEALLVALRADWVPWLLGLADPVFARASASPDCPQVSGVGTVTPQD